MLLTKTMKVVRQACMSKAGYDKAMDVLDELDGILCRLEPDIGCNESCDFSDDEEDKEGELNKNNAGDGMEDDNTITCHKMDEHNTMTGCEHALTLITAGNQEDNMRIPPEVGDTSSPCHVTQEQMEHIAASSEAKKVSIDK
ncbi:uncharacterized protein [Zea mays]|uniref:uncharacterized protein n=1 Tax=Zea mays TaxID=4577 RepID=UPI0016523D2F|nr:uncharacterized protein LOC103649393 [Zea mays]